MVIAALAITLLITRQPDELLLIGNRIDTWELEESADESLKWEDKSKPPSLTVSNTYEIA